MNKSILSKLTFDNVQHNTVLPTPYADNNKYTNLVWYRQSSPTITVSNNIHILNITNLNFRLSTNNFINSSAEFLRNDFEIDINIRLLTLNSQNGFFGVGNGWLKFIIKNTFIGGLSIISSNNDTLDFNYKFEIGVDYNIIITFADNRYRLVINGEIIGYIDSTQFFKNIPATTSIPFVLGASLNTANVVENLANGLIWNLNISYGPGVKNEDVTHLTKYGKNLLSRLNFDNIQEQSTSKNFKPNLEAIYSAVTWNYDSTKVNEYNVNTTFVTNINYDYLTLLIDMNNTKNMQDVKLIEYGNYKVIYNYISVGEPEPVVIVDNNTTSALNFENDLIDKVSTTVWNKEGTSDITSVNKIFGENSFETKALGDSLYTNSNIITGGSTPFTIEFYALIKPQETQLYTEGLVITDNRILSIDKTTRNLMYSVGNSLGKIKIKYNELNKIMITFDGATTRVFVNDILDIVVGINTGIASTIYSFLSKVDVHWDKVVALLHFDGNLTDETGETWSAKNSPTYTAGVFNNAIKLQSSSKQCVYSSNGIADFSSSDFTVEFFINFQSFNAGACVLTGGWNYSAGKRTWGFLLGEGSDLNKLHFYCSTNGSTSYICSIKGHTLSTNTTYHVAAVREGSTFRLFLNGVLVGTSTSSASIYSDLSSGVTVGSYSQSEANSSYYVNAWFDEILITKGVARYTENFTPPTEPFPPNAFFTKGLIDNINIHDGIATKVRDRDPYEEFLVVDLAFDGENNSTKIVDNGILKSDWTVSGNAKISTDQKFDGFSSLFYTGGQFFTPISNEYFTINQNEDVTLNLDYYCTDSSDNTKCLIQLFKGASDRISFYLWNPNRLRIYFDGSVLSDITLPYDTTNKWVRYRVIISNNNWYIYANNILVGSFYNEKKWSGDFKVFLGESGSGTEKFSGYFKNFKIYKGVAVIPESPVGKIQLDFDNNLNDVYNNSTWTNNGVTFDQVNSVKGYAAYFNYSNSKLTCNNSLLDLTNSKGYITFDAKIINKNTGIGWDTLITSGNTGSVDRAAFAFSTTNNTIRHRVSANLYNDVFFNYVTNTYYNVNIIKDTNISLVVINDCIISSINSNLLNFNSSNQCTIGGALYNASEGFNGYIDNFKSYKEDLIKIKLDQYGTNATTIVSNEILKINFNPVGNGSYHTFKFKDVPILKNFIAEIETIVTAGNTNYTSIVFRTSDYSLNNMDKFGYVAYITGNLIRFGKGSNNNTSSWVKLGEYALTTQMVDGNIHKLKVIANDSNFKMYYDDYLVIDVNDTTYTNASPIGHVFYNFTSSLNPNIKSLALSDLNNNLIYSNNFKSKIDNAIDRPAVHLPLETNAINTGFTALTINSVGNPTYTTIDGKKCIKFELGKYLSINSNNIFNLGANSDFYIEFDFYVISFRNGAGGGNDSSIIRITGNWDNNSSAIQFNSNGNILLYGKNNKLYTTTNNFGLNSFNKLIVKRQNSLVSIILNDVVETVNNFELDFSLNGTLLGGVDQSPYAYLNGYMSNFKMFVGTSEIPETYNDKKVLNLDFNPTRKSYLFKDNNNKCIIHPVNITQRDYQDSQYCCSFNGTDQYLELGKNDLFNFGLDDFVLYFKIGIDDINSNFNKDNTIISNNIAWATGYVGVSRYQNKVSIGIYGTTGFTSNNSFINGTNEFFIIKKDNILTIDLNGEKTVFENFSNQFNLNGNNSTRIGKAYDIANNTYFNGTIYSIKVLRNTTDLSLLEDVSSQFEESFTLTNGNESDNKVILNTERKSNHNIRFVKDETNTSLIVDGEFVEVPTVENTATELKLFDEYNSNVKDVKLYDTAFIDDDIFLGNEPIDTVFGEIEYNEESEYELDIPEGDYTLKGFIEGYTDRDFFIYNTVLDYEIYRGTEYYDVNFMDEYSLDDYEINDLVTGDKYPVLKHEMIRGFISGTVNLKGCGVAAKDMKVYCYRDDTHRLIGVYDVDETGKYNIPNLDVNSKYDIIFKDETRKIKDQISNYRTPKVY